MAPFKLLLLETSLILYICDLYFLVEMKEKKQNLPKDDNYQHFSMSFKEGLASTPRAVST